MTIQPSRCVLLLPGYELDGYPKHLESQAAAELLAGWVSLWHPRLIQATEAAPYWQQANQTPGELTNLLAVLPSVAKPELNEAYRAAHDRHECHLAEPIVGWREFQQQLLEATNLVVSNEGDEALVHELCPAFAALGYAYLQIQLMTRQLRYTSNLDQHMFGEQVVSAAQACLGGDRDRACELLQSCFDCLGQERDHYYSLDVSLLDVTLLAPTTLGTSLTRQLAAAPVTSYLASAELLRGLFSNHRENFDVFKRQIEDAQICVVGGLDRERPHPLLSRESLHRDLARGRRSYHELGLQPPKVFARLSYGLSADLPAALKQNGFEAALLIAWTGGDYPEGSQAKMSWEASDGTYLPAMATRVLDVADPSSFLSLGWQTGEALDHQHVPTLVFAHWPSRTCEFYELLQIVTQYTPALGKWSTVTSYFEETDQPYHQERLNPSSFRFNWLVAADPDAWLLATKHFHLIQARCRSLQNLANLAWQLEQPPSPLPIEEESAGEATPRYAALSSEQWTTPLSELYDLADSLLDEPEQWCPKVDQARLLADSLSKFWCERLTKLLIRSAASRSDVGDKQGASVKTASPATSSRATGRILFNPQNCPLRIRAQSVPEQEFAGQEWNFASGRVGYDRYTCIDVPSMGFVAAPLATEKSTSKTKENPLAQSAGLIQNEFLEAQIDGGRGHLRTLHAPARRGNRLSMMVARRDCNQGKYAYSEMVASNVRMLTSSNMCGVVRSEGKLEFDGQRVADFQIDYEVWRGSRILEVVIRLSKLAPLPDSNPWRSAYVVRLAWPTEAAIVRSHHLGWRHSWPSGKCISPTLIEIDETDYRTHYLTGGLAFHRRTEHRFLETILAVGGEKMEHRLGLGVDLPYPQSLAHDFIDTRYAHELTADKLAASHGWLVSVNVKNVMIDLESPLVDAEGRNVGIRLFLTECQGKSTSCTVRLLQRVAVANRVSVTGASIGKLTAKEDSFTIAMRSNEQCLVDVLWAP